jgi:hypothetical protein
MVSTEPLSLFPDADGIDDEELRDAPVVAAPEPTSIAEVGLNEQVVIDLTLKHIRHLGKPSAYDLSERLAIPTPVLNDVLELMKSDGLVEIGGAVGGRHVEYSFVLTERGKQRASEALARNGYLGPAPLPFSRYLAIQQQQSVRQARVTPARVREALTELVLPDELLESVGAAITSGRSMMLYGPSGNGKSSITTAIRLRADPVRRRGRWPGDPHLRRPRAPSPRPRGGRRFDNGGVTDPPDREAGRSSRALRTADRHGQR